MSVLFPATFPPRCTGTTSPASGLAGVYLMRHQWCVHFLFNTTCIVSAQCVKHDCVGFLLPLIVCIVILPVWLERGGRRSSLRRCDDVQSLDSTEGLTLGLRICRGERQASGHGALRLHFLLLSGVESRLMCWCCYQYDYLPGLESLSPLLL